MKVELHLIQNFPPANLNRDDTGTPKDCEFGGERRARISSQCIKRSIRTSPVFADTLGAGIGIRTKRAAEHIASHLSDAQGFDDIAAQELAEVALDELISLADDGKSLGEEGKTKVLYYAAPQELKALATRVAEVDFEDVLNEATEAAHAARMLSEDATKTDQKDAKKALKNARKELKKLVKPPIKDFVKENRDRAHSVDIALFGRMLAEQPKLNLEAACQVAHAISTNRVSMEFDYYTAVDDLNPDGETGAGMIGTTGYNSSCFYRYNLIDVDHLATNLSDEEDPTEESFQQAVHGVEAFIRAAVAAIPTGKQTSFAAQARPQFVLAVIRPDGSMPMSLVNAFEQPARPVNGTSLLQSSVEKIDRHWQELTEMYGDEGSKVYLAMLDSAGTVKDLADARVKGIPALVERVIADLKNQSPTQEVAA
jgi:CRISPR system Cascade subunit CasC